MCITTHAHECNECTHTHTHTHTGKEVAEYCSRHMPEMLLSNATYKSGDLSAALKELFMTMDKKLLEKDVIRELKSYVSGGVEGESDAEVNSRFICMLEIPNVHIENAM